MKIIYAFLKEYIYLMKWKVTKFTVLCILSSAISIILPLISGNFIDDLTNAENTLFILDFLMYFGCLGLISIITRYLLTIIYSSIQSKIAFMVSCDIIEHIQKISILKTLNIDETYMSERVNNDSNSITIFIISTFQNIIGHIMTIFSPIIFIFVFDIKLGIGIIFSIILYYIIYLKFKRPLYETNKTLIEEKSRFFSKFNEQISNVKFIKTNSLYKEFIKRINNAFDSLYKIIIKSQKLNALFLGSDSIIKLISQILIYIYGGLLVYYKKITLGQFMIVYSYYMMIINSSKYFFMLGKNTQENLASLARLKEIKALKVDTNGSENILDIKTIEVSNLEFSYNGIDFINYHDITFEKGHTYAILGDNGSGKTTFINLIIGLFSSYRGDVKYNDITIKNLDMIDIRKKLISIVEQDPVLLSGSIYDNISLLNSYEIDKARLKYISKLLSADKFVCEKFDDRSENILNKLSGGEQQKIALIRAFTKKPKLVILDEPTSALDSDSTNNFIEYINDNKKEYIIIIITHDSYIASKCDYKYNII